MILEKSQKQMKEFENLLEEKQGLDAEIGVFRKLVETEEERLGLSKGRFINISKIISFCFR